MKIEQMTPVEAIIHQIETDVAEVLDPLSKNVALANSALYLYLAQVDGLIF